MAGEKAGANWDGGWETHRQLQLESWLRATPSQRLAWLEEALAFAAEAGALGPAVHRPR